jgi:uncharacterized protein YjaZ
MEKQSIQVFIIFSALSLLLPACTESDVKPVCGSASMTITNDDICLLIEHKGLSAEQESIIQNRVTSGITEIKKHISVNSIKIRIVNNPGLVIPEIGMGGFNPDPYNVIIAINHTFLNLEQSLETNLIPQLAHEIHHAMRRRSIGYGNTLFQAVISEGLADHFSIEVTGIDPPPWSIALPEDEIDKWITIASESWNQSSYNHNAWFVGTDPAIPRWTGYSMGYTLINNYLADHPGSHASDLVDIPATEFEP